MIKTSIWSLVLLRRSICTFSHPSMTTPTVGEIGDIRPILLCFTLNTKSKTNKQKKKLRIGQAIVDSLQY